MNMMQKNLLAVSVASALLVAPLANAAWTTGSATINVVAQGKSTLKDDAAATANIVYTLAAGESLTVNDTITVNLTGGLTFDGTTTVTATPSAGDIGGGALTASVPLSGGGAGSTTATWRVISQVAAGSTITFNTSGTIFDTNGVASGNKADITVDLQTSGSLPIGPAAQSLNTDLETSKGAGDAYLFKGVDLTKTTVTSATSTAQVSTVYKYLEDSATDVLTDAGTINTTTNSAATSIPTAVIAAGNLLYTLTGDFTGIKSIGATGVSGATSSGAASSPAVANGFAINSDKTAAYATNTAAIAAAGALNIGDLILTLDGTTSQAARTFTIATQILGDTTWNAHETQSATAITIINRNGTFFTTNSTGPLNNLKITDQSGGLPAGGGDILYEAWDSAGNKLTATGSPALPSSVANNGTTTVSGADIVANFPDAVRIDVTVNSSDANISNVKKTDSGVNLSTYRSGSGGSL